MSLFIRLRGGLGNQMFQYASALSLSHKESQKLVIDNFSGFLNDKKYQRSFMLDFFNINSTKIFDNKIFSLIYLIKFKFFHSLNRRLYIKTFNYFDDNYSINKISFHKNKDIYLNGLWQNFKYFDHLKAKITKEFTIKKKYRVNIRNSFKNFNINNSISVHIRNYDKKQKKKKNNLPELYYLRAFEYIVNKIKNPKFYVFSDDVSYASFLLKNFEYDIVIANNLSMENNEIADFTLMSQFKNFIVANSTFSWWAAYLSKFDNKTIIYPNKNLKKYKKKWEFNLEVPNDWILI